MRAAPWQLELSRSWICSQRSALGRKKIWRVVSKVSDLRSDGDEGGAVSVDVYVFPGQRSVRKFRLGVGIEGGVEGRR